MTWIVKVRFIDQTTVEILVDAGSERAAETIGRKRAVAIRPYAGTPIDVTVGER